MDKEGDNMGNKIIVKRGQRKRPGDFTWSQGQTHTRLCVFLVFSAMDFLTYPGFSVYIHNRGIIALWHLNILSRPEQVGRKIIFRRTHFGGKCTKFTIKCDSTLYIHDWFLFKNPCNMYPLFQWENCRWLVLGHVGIWVRSRHCHTTTHLIHYLILLGTLKTQITENSFWVQGPTFMNPPFWSITWVPKS